MDIFNITDLTSEFTVLDVVLVLTLSFLTSAFIGWVYKQTHRGTSYTQSFVFTLVMNGMIVALVMMIVGSNIARAFSLVGALSIIRFRNAVKETRDVGFIFFTMAIGMAIVVGCVASFYPMVYGIPQAMVQVMDRAGVDFATLGGEEWCCGYPLFTAGMEDLVADLMAHNVARVREMGAKTLVTTCPSCHYTWAHLYPLFDPSPLGFEVLHASQYLARLLEEGELRLGSFEQVVTYHDPCDLGRKSGVYDAPRQVIEAVPGIEFREMGATRENALCCGGGGDVQIVDESVTAAVADRRLGQAQRTGARVVLSACQQCKRTLMAAARRNKVRVRVMDIAELVWRAIEG